MIINENTARRIALDLAGVVSWLQQAKRSLPTDPMKPELCGFSRLAIDFAEDHIARVLEQLPPSVTAPMIEYFTSVANKVDRT